MIDIADNGKLRSVQHVRFMFVGTENELLCRDEEMLLARPVHSGPSHATLVYSDFDAIT